ncbi:MAG: desulfoferrodoxin family protein [Candidatus Thiodiazotropha sp. 6PDIVS]
MDRRTFLLNSTSAVAIATLGNSANADEVAAAAISDVTVKRDDEAAATTSAVPTKTGEEATMPPVNLVYTQKNPGKWKSKKGTHIPHFEITGRKIRVNTEHGQSERHFIVRHTLLLEDGTVVGANTFTANDAPISEYNLPAGYKGKIYATSFCNKHDLWVSEENV